MTAPVDLTDEQLAIQDVCREFAAREIRPISLAVDEADVEVPWEVWRKAAGARPDLVHAARGVRRRGDDRLPDLVRGPGGALARLLGDRQPDHLGRASSPNRCWPWATEEQKRRWLTPLAGDDPPMTALAITEPESGSDAASIRTRARRVDGGYVLSGQKAWISNGGVSRFYVIFATVDPGLRLPRDHRVPGRGRRRGLPLRPADPQDGPARDPQHRAVPRRRVRAPTTAGSATRARDSRG